MPEPHAVGVPPPGGPRPPAPPGTGDPGRGPDPSDPGPPITVCLDGTPLGDLGNRRVDASLLAAIAMRGGAVSAWLRARDITAETLDPPPVRSAKYDIVRQAVDRPLAVHLDDLSLGELGSAGTDSRLVSAVLVRGGAMSAWLQDRTVNVDDVERAFPDSRWP
jgi:hypothetical protein